MDQVNLFTKSRQENRILHSNIPAADHCRHFLLIKSAVTGRTIRNTSASQPFFPGHAKLFVLRTGCNNDRLCRKLPSRRQNLFAVRQIFDSGHIRFHKFRTESVRMLPKLHAEVKAVDTGKPQIVIHLTGI